MIKIGIMGAPSTGKTTLAKELSIHLLYHKGKLAEYIDEYARQFVARFGVPTIFDQYFFFEQQLKKERAVSPTTEYLVTDSPFYLSYIYGSKVMNRDSEKDRLYFHALVERLLEHVNDYDYVIYLPSSDGHLQADGMRIHTTVFDQQDVDERIRGFFSIYNIHYHTVTGTLADRIEKCCEIVGVDQAGNKRTLREGKEKTSG